MIKLENLSKSYTSGDTTICALEGINLDIGRGEFVAIMGRSGCGKSSLLNVIGLLDAPSSGRLVFNDIDIGQATSRQRAQLRKQHIGFVFQSNNLIEQLSVAENIDLAMLYRHFSRKERKHQLYKVMDLVGIAHRAEHFPSQLSGGQQQRVALARAIAGGQSIILTDEPTGNLDGHNSQHMMQILQSLNAQGISIIMATHSSVDAGYAHRVIQLHDGKIRPSADIFSVGYSALNA